MFQTYQAIIRGNQVEWLDKVPPMTSLPVRVHVTFLDEPVQSPTCSPEEGRAALERLAARGTFAEITDPVAWQREVRKDRPLPGRD